MSALLSRGARRLGLVALLATLVLAGRSAAFAQDSGTPTPTTTAVTPSATTAPTTAADTSVTEAAVFVAGAAVTVADGPLNLRSEGALAGSVLATLPTATNLWVTGGSVSADGHTWYPVTDSTYGGGWVAGEFLANDADGPFALDQPAYVFDGPLNVRASAGTSSAVTTTVDAGTQLTLVSGPTVANGFGWYQVNVDSSTSGWVAGQFLTDEATDLPTEQFATGSSVVVFDGALNMRDGAGLTANVVTVLPDGAALTVIGGSSSADGYTWYPVTSANAGDGWVAGEFLKAAT